MVNCGFTMFGFIVICCWALRVFADCRLFVCNGFVIVTLVVQWVVFALLWVIVGLLCYEWLFDLLVVVLCLLCDVD